MIFYQFKSRNDQFLKIFRFNKTNLAVLSKIVSRTIATHNNIKKDIDYNAVSKKQIEHFENLASSWWEFDGPQRILHQMNIFRVKYMLDIIDKNNININSNFYKRYDKSDDEKILQTDLDVLDVGCGAGILCESLARLTMFKSVTGIDMSKTLIEVAKNHKLKDIVFENKLKYRCQSIEDIDDQNKFNIITLFEILEHVEYPFNMLSKSLDLVKVGGIVFLSTINRSLYSWFITILIAENFLKIVPPGTHCFDRYINMTEIKNWFYLYNEKKNFKIIDITGCVYLPFIGWKHSNNSKNGNYFIAIQKIA